MIRSFCNSLLCRSAFGLFAGAAIACGGRATSVADPADIQAPEVTAATLLSPATSVLLTVDAPRLRESPYVQRGSSLMNLWQGEPDANGDLAMPWDEMGTLYLAYVEAPSAPSAPTASPADTPAVEAPAQTPALDEQDTPSVDSEEQEEQEGEFYAFVETARSPREVYRTEHERERRRRAAEARAAEARAAAAAGAAVDAAEEPDSPCEAADAGQLFGELASTLELAEALQCDDGSAAVSVKGQFIVWGDLPRVRAELSRVAVGGEVSDFPTSDGARLLAALPGDSVVTLVGRHSVLGERAPGMQAFAGRIDMLNGVSVNMLGAWDSTEAATGAHAELRQALGLAALLARQIDMLPEVRSIQIERAGMDNRLTLEISHDRVLEILENLRERIEERNQEQQNESSANETAEPVQEGAEPALTP